MDKQQDKDDTVTEKNLIILHKGFTLKKYVKPSPVVYWRYPDIENPMYRRKVVRSKPTTI